MNPIPRIMCVVVVLMLVGCETVWEIPSVRTYELEPEEWTAGFADLPVEHDEAMFELEHGVRPLPAPLEGTGLYLQGHNRSDDLFMFVKSHLGGLTPEAEYDATFVVDLATSVPVGLVGIGGAPGESVHVKAGATQREPKPEADDAGYWRMNIDKGNQAREGTEMINLGHIAHPGLGGGAGEVFMMKRLDSQGRPFRFTADAKGRIWIIIGTDSGFEGPTEIYVAEVSMRLERVKPGAS